MQPFDYASPATREQAVQLLAAQPDRATALAGGSDLLALMKDGVVTPGRLVNLKGIAALHGIHYAAESGFRIGALTRIDELATSEVLRLDHPAVSETAGRLAGPQIRNVATVGGNLCQRPRCWYFRNGFGLLPMRDGKSMVLEGDNRYHAILGNDGPAYFVTPSTLAPVLIALDAEVAVLGPQGERRIPLEKLYRVPQAAGEREHDLAAGEIVTELVLGPPAGRQVANYEVRQRETLDWSLATAAVALEAEAGRVKRARVVLGQVAPVPWTAHDVESFLVGKSIDESVAEEAGKLAVQGAKPLSRNRYKIQLARVAVRRALLAAAGAGKEL
ncbi:MAG TPA: xanthine dehydrogenase family protein subunit M [Thermoanaerobaculia bacterium]|nr:xanthine dehydrogenase family protein subunit M [Thermoanaerobaculia bacterium]